MKKAKLEQKGNEIIRAVKKRLYAYPQLKENVKEYEKDIEDIKVETFGRDKSIVLRAPRVAEPLSIEEKRAARIMILERRLEADEKEIKEIERAMKKIEKEEYSGIIRAYYFERERVNKIAKEMKCDESTVYRQKARLLDMLSVIMYGAEALV